MPKILKKISGAENSTKIILEKNSEAEISTKHFEKNVGV